ncbi:MAG: phosphoribosylformylglycinamidine synthase [Planctomycetaceae bacterium]|nr:MAG: phosphoribosylformylglycinamidine synthase [Planctomycetaceae bacterium]
MPQPRVCVLRAPGTNCDVETAWAFEQAGGLPERVHLFRLLEQPSRLRDYQILCLPGGFSYGDDLGAGVVFGIQLRHRLEDALRSFLARDTLILGICNGFQVLVKARLLPDGEASWSSAARRCTLTWNTNGRYTARWVRCRVTNSHNVFLRGLTELELPIAHAEGRFYTDDLQALAAWERAGQLALKYIPWCADESGAVWQAPANPNGSLADVAGLSDPTGRILGLMPHPERYVHATQHPQWTRRGLRGNGEGAALFANAIRYFVA